MPLLMFPVSTANPVVVADDAGTIVAAPQETVTSPIIARRISSFRTMRD